VVDAIILAAGNGERVRGVTARGLKPLLLVEGEPLIARLVRQASVADRVTVVVSPLNAPHIVDVLEAKGFDDVRYIVQPQATGPTDAMRRGLDTSRGALTLVVLGDNVVSDSDFAAIAQRQAPAVGVRTFARDDPRIEGLGRRLSTGEWVEKCPLRNADTGVVWAGLVLVETKLARPALAFAKDEYIVPLFTKFSVRPMREIEVATRDIMEDFGGR
jgi:CTP:molybdopterin cytidylyltransferase MocA